MTRATTLGEDSRARPPQSTVLVLAIATSIAVIAFAATVYIFGPAWDALGYLAAGERLNVGHLLYQLGPGDRPIHIDPPAFTSPFLYPPAFALIWRVLAWLPDMSGLWAWWAGSIAVMTVWLGLVVRTMRPYRAMAALLLSFPIGQTMATGNLNGLVMVAFGVCWALRDRPITLGLVVGTLASWKVFPGVLLIWMVATGRWRAAIWVTATFVAWTIAGLVIVGPDATVTYLTQVIPSTEPMGLSAASLLHLPVITYALLGAGVAAVLLLRSRPAMSYAAAVITAVLGWPSLGIASLSLLMGLAAVEFPGREAKASGMTVAAQPGG